MKKSRGIAGLLGTILMIALLGLYSEFRMGRIPQWGYEKYQTWPGSGRRGQYHLSDEEKNPSDEDMRDTVYKLQKRVETYSTEASVYQEGDRRISISIPGVSDANEILEELGQPGTLEFQTSDGGNGTYGKRYQDC